jgi:hypothetical protein
LELVGLQPGTPRPAVLVQAIDAKGGVLHSERVGEAGTFALPAEALKNARYVVIGAPGDEKTVAEASAIRFRPDEFDAAVIDGTLPLAEGVWGRFRVHWTCTSGSVRVCRRRRPWFDELFTAVAGTSIAQRMAARSFQASYGTSADMVTSLAGAAIADVVAWPVRCFPVCLGRVTVFRRTCCCWPLVIDDPRIPVLIRDLGRIVEQLPKFPPGKFPPPPPPPDPFTTPLFKGGGLNELALNAPADLRTLRSLAGEAAVQYVNSRAYLLRHICSCGAPQRMGSGAVLADGTFNVCWIEPWRFLLPNCHDEFAYVVTQTIGGTTTTIYDGLAAGAWYHAGDNPVLTTYRSDAFSCNETGTTGGDAVVFLDLIGQTESHHLTTPDSTAWDRVDSPNDQSGLLFPVDVGQGLLRNLGGSLHLTYTFSESLKQAPVGAVHYRVSVTKADENGNPVGDRVYYRDPLSWDQVVGSDIVPVVLGPVPPADVGGEMYLYKIPYHEGVTWTGATTYHALIDTKRSGFAGPVDVADAPQNHLVTLEIFDGTGRRLRPLGTPASGQPGAEDAKPFKFRRWFQAAGSPGDDTKEVPFAALTHLFCWDNRAPVADIERLVLDGSASNEPCQFLTGSGDAEFAIEYRAYVPDPRFQYGHSIGWKRGLNGTTLNGGAGSLPTPLSPSNVGMPPAAPQVSGANTFETMLTVIEPNPTPPPATRRRVLDRCAFAVTLTTCAKTTDGADFTYPPAEEEAAFALEIDETP